MQAILVSRFSTSWKPIVVETFFEYLVGYNTRENQVKIYGIEKIIGLIVHALTFLKRGMLGTLTLAARACQVQSANMCQVLTCARVCQEVLTSAKCARDDKECQGMRGSAKKFQGMLTCSKECQGMSTHARHTKTCYVLRCAKMCQVGRRANVFQCMPRCAKCQTIMYLTHKFQINYIDQYKKRQTNLEKNHLYSTKDNYVHLPLKWGNLLKESSKYNNNS